MANIKSQKKRVLTNEKAHKRNVAVKSSLKTAVRATREAIAAGDKAAAEAAYKVAAQKLDKAAGAGVIAQEPGCQPQVRSRCGHQRSLSFRNSQLVRSPAGKTCGASSFYISYSVENAHLRLISSSFRWDQMTGRLRYLASLGR